MSSASDTGFAKGFASTFVPLYTAKKEAQQEKENDRIKLGAKAFLNQEDDYKSKVQEEKELWKKAEAIQSLEPSVPKNATGNIVKLLDSGLTTDQILKEVRKQGVEWNLKEQEESKSANVNEQTETMLSDSPKTENNEEPEKEKSAFGKYVSNRVEEIGDNVRLAFGQEKEYDSPNPFDTHKSEIMDYVGKDQEYFDKIMEGYNPRSTDTNYTFVPGVSSNGANSVSELVALTVQNDPEYKKAVAEGNTDDIMAVLSKAAQVTKGDRKPPAFDMNNPAKSLMDIYLYSPAGDDAMRAAGNGDTTALSEAFENALKVGNDLVNKSNEEKGFKPEQVTNLNQIPGLKIQYENDPVVLEQLDTLTDELTAQTEGGRSKFVNVFTTTPNGEPLLIGTGRQQNGKLYLPDPKNPNEEKQVPLSIMSQLQTVLQEETTQAPSQNTKEGQAVRSQLSGVGSLLNTSTNYLATLEKNKYARTRVASATKGVGDLLREFDALKKVAQIVDPNGSGEQILSKKRMLDEITNQVTLGDMNEITASVLAQEVRLTFAIAKSQGNSGQALSNKDYDNYYSSIFNSTDTNVVERNIKGLIAESYGDAIRQSNAFGAAPGMQYVRSASGTRWWSDPDNLILSGANAGVQELLKQALEEQEELQMNSSFGREALERAERERVENEGGSPDTEEEDEPAKKKNAQVDVPLAETAQREKIDGVVPSVAQRIELYKSGQNIFVDEEFVTENPLFEPFLGTTINANLGSGDSK